MASFIPCFYGMVGSRLLHPAADRPPWTLLKFDITADPQAPRQGQRVTLSAELQGPSLPREAELVLRHGQARQAIPMLREADNRFILTLERADGPMTFCVSTPLGRSSWQTLQVTPIRPPETGPQIAAIQKLLSLSTELSQKLAAWPSQPSPATLGELKTLLENYLRQLEELKQLIGQGDPWMDRLQSPIRDLQSLLDTLAAGRIPDAAMAATLQASLRQTTQGLRQLQNQALAATPLATGSGEDGPGRQVASQSTPAQTPTTEPLAPDTQEKLEPPDTDPQAATARQPAAVPLPYRELTERYFRRLAQER